MKKYLWLGVGLIALLAFNGDVMARITGTQPTNPDAFCAGADGAEACIDSSGNFVPTTDNDATLGTDALDWATGYFEDIDADDDVSIGDDLTVTGDIFKALVSTATPMTASTISIAGACGGVLRLSTNQDVTTDTTNTVTAAATANEGCRVILLNVGNSSVTLDDNANFVIGAGYPSAGAITLGTGDTVEIVSIGTAWYMIGTVGDN